MIIFVAESAEVPDWHVWLPIVVSGAAFLVSMAVFVVSFGRRKKDRFIAAYETMVQADQQGGRRTVFTYYEAGERSLDALWDKNGEKDRDSVNNALGSFDVLGYYTKRRWVKRRDVLRLWDRALVQTCAPAVEFMAQRDARETAKRDAQDDSVAKECPGATSSFILWPFFRDLIAAAQTRSDRKNAWADEDRLKAFGLWLVTPFRRRAFRHTLDNLIEQRATEVRNALPEEDAADSDNDIDSEAAADDPGGDTNSDSEAPQSKRLIGGHD